MVIFDAHSQIVYIWANIFLINDENGEYHVTNVASCAILIGFTLFLLSFIRFYLKWSTLEFVVIVYVTGSGNWFFGVVVWNLFVRAESTK